MTIVDRALAVVVNRSAPVIFATALILAGALAAVLAWQTQMPSGLVAGEPPDNVARELLRSEVATACFEEAIFDYYLPPTLAEADRLPTGNRWLSTENLHGYLGDLTQAAADLNAEYVGRANDKAWLKVVDAKGPVVLQYTAVMTPKGRTLWILGSTDRPQDDANCT